MNQCELDLADAKGQIAVLRPQVDALRSQQASAEGMVQTCGKFLTASEREVTRSRELEEHLKAVTDAADTAAKGLNLLRNNANMAHRRLGARGARQLVQDVAVGGQDDPDDICRHLLEALDRLAA